MTVKASFISRGLSPEPPSNYAHGVFKIRYRLNYVLVILNLTVCEPVLCSFASFLLVTLVSAFCVCWFTSVNLPSPRLFI